MLDIHMRHLTPINSKGIAMAPAAANVFAGAGHGGKTAGMLGSKGEDVDLQGLVGAAAANFGKVLGCMCLCPLLKSRTT